jgi:cytosine/uracil/thiamine/allantoin permease
VFQFQLGLLEEDHIPWKRRCGFHLLLALILLLLAFGVKEVREMQLIKGPLICNHHLIGFCLLIGTPLEFCFMEIFLHCLCKK